MQYVYIPTYIYMYIHGVYIYIHTCMYIHIEYAFNIQEGLVTWDDSFETADRPLSQRSASVDSTHARTVHTGAHATSQMIYELWSQLLLYSIQPSSPIIRILAPYKEL